MDIATSYRTYTILQCTDFGLTSYWLLKDDQYITATESLQSAKDLIDNTLDNK